MLTHAHGCSEQETVGGSPWGCQVSRNPISIGCRGPHVTTPAWSCWDDGLLAREATLSHPRLSQATRETGGWDGVGRPGPGPWLPRLGGILGSSVSGARGILMYEVTSVTWFSGATPSIRSPVDGCFMEAASSCLSVPLLASLPSPLFCTPRLSHVLSKFKGTHKCLGSHLDQSLRPPVGGPPPHQGRLALQVRMPVCQGVSPSPSVGWGATDDNDIRQCRSGLDVAAKQTQEGYPCLENERTSAKGRSRCNRRI